MKKLLSIFSIFLLSFGYAQSILVTGISGAPVCSGSNVTVTFRTTSGNGSSRYDNQSVFTAYLSSSTGSTPYTNLGTFSPSVTFTGGNGGVTSGITQSITIPVGTAAGTGYKISIGSSNPTFNGSSGAGASAAFTVLQGSIGGSVISNQNICTGSEPSSLTLSGQTGTVIKWQSSTSATFATSTDIANTTTTLTGAEIGNLTTTTYFRAVVQSGTCPTANSAAATITVNPLSVGGTVASSTTVCSGTNSGTLTLSGKTGTIVRWESSLDNFATAGTAISNTTTTLNYSNITATTSYRAVVMSGACASATSSVATITVTPVSVGGSVASPATVCSGSNSGTLTLSGQTGNIVRWESSLNNFSTAGTAIANTTTTLNYTNLTATTSYRAVVMNGVCASANSSSATITVNPVSVGGTVSSSTSVCTGTNSGTLTLSGQTGSVVGWESSLDNFATAGTAIANTTTTLNYSNLTATTSYRAVVMSGVCASANSNAAKITVNPVSVGGTVSSPATVCAGSNSGTLTLSGQTGNVLRWQSSLNNFATAGTTINNTTTTLNYTNLTATTSYRAVVMSGVCASANSRSVTITVNPNVTYYLDADNDGFGNPAASQVSCMGAPAGYVLDNTDCDDTDGSIHQTFSFYVDADGDTFGAGNLVSVCAMDATTPPAGYSLNNTDCDDNNAAANTTFAFYVDADNDGFGTGNLVPACAADGTTAPVGYSTNNTDCDDNNAAVYQSMTLFVDADNDGYTSGETAVVCYGASFPSGYAMSNIGIDCNDNVAAINPGMSEVLYNGVDDNCDGNLDEGFQLKTKILASQCGTTLQSISSVIGITTLNQPITGYRIRVTDTSTNSVQFLQRSIPNFQLTSLPSYNYARTYSIAIELQRSGVWLGYYGDPCLISTPAVLSPGGATQVNTSQCGNQLPTINTLISTTSLAGVTGYRFRVTDVTPGSTGFNLIQVIDRGLQWFSLPMLTRFNYGATYTVEVAIKTTGAYSGYGAPCTVYAPSVPTLINCGATVESATTLIPARSVQYATQYRFTVVRLSTGASVSFDTNRNYFSFGTNVEGYAPGEQYGVTVAVMSAGTFSILGDGCEITSPSAAATRMVQTTPKDEVLRATAYPNPFVGTFKVDVSTTAVENVNIRIYDMTGRLLETKTSELSDVNTIEMGDQYPSGVYNVIVNQGNDLRTIRVIKR